MKTGLLALVIFLSVGMLVGLAYAQPFAYVTNHNGDTVSIINTATNVVEATVNMRDRPEGIAMTPDGAFAYVANRFARSVSVINTATYTVVAIVEVGPDPVGVAITPDGAFAYVTEISGDRVRVINTATNTVEDTIAVGSSPQGIAITPDGAFAYVANKGSDSVSVINTATNTVEDTVTAGKPIAIAITPDGSFAYVTEDIGGQVSVINTATNTVEDTIAVGSSPQGIAITPDGAFAYVTNIQSDNVSVIDMATNTVEETVTVGDAPVGVAITPDGDFAYVAHANSDDVWVINTDVNVVEATVSVGSDGTSPIRIAITPNGGPTPEPDPGPGVTQFNPATGHFYQVLEGTWDDVQGQAAEKGGHLATINDPDEQRWLVDTFDMDFVQEKSNGVITTVSYWIGLSDRDAEGEYVWASGETLAETGYGDNPFPSPPWAPLEPSDNAGGAGTEDNVGMNFLICDFAPDSPACLDFPNSGDPGLWNDYAGNNFLEYGIVENEPPLYSLDVIGSFLRTDSIDTSTDPVIIDLATVALAPGALLRIVQRGDFQPGENPNPNFVFEDNAKFMNGVFSASNILLDPSQLVRVPDAINAGVDVFSDPTGIEGLPTDISEDFDLEREGTLVIPQGATHLFVGVRDVFLQDNSDPDGDLGFDLVRFPSVFADPSVSIGVFAQIGPGSRLGPDVVIGDNAVIGNQVRIQRNASLGTSVTVGNQTTIQLFAIISHDVVIGSNTTIDRLVKVLNSASIGNSTFVGRRSVVCSDAQVGANVQIGRNNLIDTNAVVPDGTQIPPQGEPPTPADCTAP